MSEEQIKITVQDVSPVKRRVEVEVPAGEVDRELDDLVRKTARSVRIPGFRKGKVPLDLVRRRYGAELEKEATERLVGKYHAQAVQERELKPLHEPVLEEVAFRKGEPLKFRTVFEVRPEIELGKYRGLATEKEPEAVTDEDVVKALDSLRESAAQYAAVDPRPLEKGDHAILDVHGRFVEGEGEDFDREALMMEVGAEDNVPEFNDALPGLSPGDEKTFVVAYGQDFEAKHLAGRKVEYRATIREIKRRVLPELDEDFAREVGEPGGLDALKGRIRKDLEASRRQTARREAREAALGKLVDSHPFDVPEVLLEDQIRSRMEDFARSLAARGVDPSTVQIDWNEFREKERPVSLKRVRGMLLLDAIVRKESLEISEDEVTARIEREAKEGGVKPEVLRGRLEREIGMQALKNQMLREKALDILLNDTTIAA